MVFPQCPLRHAVSRNIHVAVYSLTFSFLKPSAQRRWWNCRDCVRPRWRSWWMKILVVTHQSSHYVTFWSRLPQSSHLDCHFIAGIILSLSACTFLLVLFPATPLSAVFFHSLPNRVVLCFFFTSTAIPVMPFSQHTVRRSTIFYQKGSDGGVRLGFDYASEEEILSVNNRWPECHDSLPFILTSGLVALLQVQNVLIIDEKDYGKERQFLCSVIRASKGEEENNFTSCKMSYSSWFQPAVIWPFTSTAINIKNTDRWSKPNLLSLNSVVFCHTEHLWRYCFEMCHPSARWCRAADYPEFSPHPAPKNKFKKPQKQQKQVIAKEKSQEEKTTTKESLIKGWNIQQVNQTPTTIERGINSHLLTDCDKRPTVMSQKNPNSF